MFQYFKYRLKNYSIFVNKYDYRYTGSFCYMLSNQMMVIHQKNLNSYVILNIAHFIKKFNLRAMLTLLLYKFFTTMSSLYKLPRHTSFYSLNYLSMHLSKLYHDNKNYLNIHLSGLIKIIQVYIF